MRATTVSDRERSFAVLGNSRHERTPLCVCESGRIRTEEEFLIVVEGDEGLCHLPNHCFWSIHKPYETIDRTYALPPVPSASVIKPASLQDVEWDDSQLEVCSGSGDSSTFSTRRDVNRIGSRWCTRCARACVCVVLCVRVCVLTKLWPFLRPRGFALSVHDCARACRTTPQSETCTRRVYAKVRKGPVRCVFFLPKSVRLFYCVFGLVPCFFWLK